MTNNKQKPFLNRFGIKETDLIEIFKDSKIASEEDTTIGCFARNGKIIDGLEIEFYIVITTGYLSFAIADSAVNIISFELNRTVKNITRTKNVDNNEDFFTVTNDCLQIIKIYFKPNYSVGFSKLWLSRSNQIFPDMHRLSCDFEGLDEIFGSPEVIGQTNVFFYKAKNDAGFTFTMSINHSELSCSIELWYDKYARPVYTASFGGVFVIETYGTNIFLQGQFDDVVVIIYTAQNFALSDFKERMWYLPPPRIKDHLKPNNCYFFEIVDDLLEIFRHGSIYLDDFENELGRIDVSMEDNFGFEINCYLIIIEQTFQIIISHANASIIYCNMLHRVINAIRTKNIEQNEDYFTIIREEELPTVKIYFQPNYSIELPLLWVSNKNKVSPETHTLSCDFEKLKELLWPSEIPDQNNNSVYRTSNNKGLSFSLSINSKTLSCSLELLYEQYSRPIYTVSFGGVLSITIDNKNIVIKGQYDDSFVTIFTDNNFGMSELKGRIWNQ